MLRDRRQKDSLQKDNMERNSMERNRNGFLDSCCAADYLETLASQIRSPRARAAVREELAAHLEDQADAYQAMGMERDAAFAKATEQMGDPVAVGMDLDRIHRPRSGWRILIPILLLSLLGLWAQYFFYYRFSDALLESHNFSGSPQGVFLFQCLMTLLGIGVMAVMYFLDYSNLASFSWILGSVFFLGILGLCRPGILPSVNGGYSYLKSLLYLFVPIYGGILSRCRGKGIGGAAACFLWMMVAFFLGVYRIGGGFGVSFDMLTICYVMFLIAIGRGWFALPFKKLTLFTAGVLLPAMAAFAGFYRMPDYQSARIQAILHPDQFLGEQNYLMGVARTITSSLGFYGSDYQVRMLENQLPMQRLPDVRHEYMMLQIASIGGLAVVLLFILLLACFYLFLARMIFRQRNQAGQMIGLGCVLVLTLETFRNLFNNFGFYTMSTGGLPFFTYGKCHTIMVYALLGVLLSIYRYQDVAAPVQHPARRYPV